MKRVLLILSILLLSGVTLSIADGPAPAQPDAAGCKIIFTNGGADMICLDAEGKYVPEVQGATVQFQGRGLPQLVRCYRWRGAYKPASLTPDAWASLAEIRSVTPEEFRAIIDKSEAGKAGK